MTLIAVSAFGPFLDVVTGVPINWLLGLLVLVFAATVAVEGFASPAVTIRRIPFLALTVVVWNYWYVVQILRPGINHVNALMAFRVPLVGLAAYLLTFVLAMRCRSRHSLEIAITRFAMVVATVGILVASYTIFQWIVGYDRLQAWHLLETGGAYLVPNVEDYSPVFRPFGTMRRNEALAAFLVIVEIVAISAWRLPSINKRRLVVSIVLCIAAMFLSLSLTGVVTFVIWLCLLAMAKLRWKIIRTALLLLLLTAVAGYVANEATNGLLRMRIYGHQMDVARDRGRLQMFENWIAEMRHRSVASALFGTGICTGVEETSAGRIEEVLRTFGLRAEIVPCGWAREVHDNWFATLSLEVGLAGLFLVWCFYGVAALYAIQYRRSDVPVRVFAFMAALGIVAFWPAGFVGALTLYHPVNIYFWSVAGIIEATHALAA